MPGLRGSAAKGRFIYLVHEATCIVEPIWIYTHDEFDARPPDRDLRDAFREAMERAATYLEQNPLIDLTDPTGGHHTVKVMVDRTDDK